MNKVRIAIAEMEGSDEAVLEAIRTCVGLPKTNGLAIAESPARALPPPSIEARPTPEVVSEKPARRSANGNGKPPRRVAHMAGHETEGPVPTNAEGPLYERLKKGALTSGELIKLFPQVSPASVYSNLNSLRKKELIETRIDDSDGQRKNYVR